MSSVAKENAGRKDAKLDVYPSQAEFLCPITQDLFEEPVVASDGHTYERVAIEQWYSSGKTRSPVTNEELCSFILVPNHNLHKLVDSHRQAIGKALLNSLNEEKMQNASPPALKEIRHFVDVGADLNVRDNDGNTPLMVAVSKGYKEVVHLLLEAGAMVTCSNDQRLTAHAIARTRNDMDSIVRKLAVLELKEGERLVREQDARRLEQERHRAQQLKQKRENLLGSNSNLSHSSGFPAILGFFPSLFGLQFQGIVDFTDGRSENGAVMSSLLHDQDQQAFLSRILLTFGSIVILGILIIA